MYPDQVEKIRRLQEGAATFTDERAYRRHLAELHVARRYRFRAIMPDERDRIEYWVINGGLRPWGI